MFTTLCNICTCLVAHVCNMQKRTPPTYCLQVQFTELKKKKKKTDCNQTICCGCPILRSVVISSVQLKIYIKTVQRPVAISCNRSGHGIYKVQPI